MHADSLQKCIWTRACAHIQRCSGFRAMKAIANLSCVLREHCAGCRLPLALLPAALLLAISQLTLFTKNPSKSTLAHDAVAAAVLHKHHPIIRVGAGLIQFVYGSHSRWATGVTSSKILFPPSFGASFSNYYWSCHCHTCEQDQEVFHLSQLSGCHHGVVK